VAITAVNQRASIAVSNPIGDQLRLHPRARHQRDRRVPEPVETEVCDDDRAAVRLRLLVREPAANSAGSQIERKPLFE